MSEEANPTLLVLIREWLKEDPILKDHFSLDGNYYNEGAYIETKCDWSARQKIPRYRVGYSLAMIPYENNPDRRIPIYYHDSGGASRVRGYLKREDPLFMEKLRDYLVRGHDALYDRCVCRIRWEFGETLPDREQATRQKWYEAGGDL